MLASKYQYMLFISLCYVIDLHFELERTPSPNSTPPTPSYDSTTNLNLTYEFIARHIKLLIVLYLQE